MLVPGAPVALLGSASPMITAAITAAVAAVLSLFGIKRARATTAA